MSSRFQRSLIGVTVLAVLSSAMPLAAQTAPEVAGPAEAQQAWLDVISRQIQAFRDRDAPVAFGYAGAGFQTTFPSAEAFFAAIISSGYGPIMESKSHSFGPYQMVGTGGVVQEVRFTGLDQSLHRAVYQLTMEPAGWRVQGVQLLKEAGIAI